MPLPFALRFDLRNPPIGGTTAAERYATALDIVEWADTRGCLAVALSEHHASPDGYLPSPLIMLAAMAARTKNVHLSIAALIAPFHDPLRLAEDLSVLDHLSNGRVSLIIAAGYVREEFEMFGVPSNERAKRVTETIATLKAAFTGQPFEYRGRTVTVTPAPFTPGGPGLTLGGSSERAARRAARLGIGFLPSMPEIWDFYRDEIAVLGGSDPGPSPIGANRTVALAENVERGWEQMGPYFLHEMNAYGAWHAAALDAASPYSMVADLDELRRSGSYAVLTPEQYIEELKAQPFPFAMLHPLCGGMPPELAWSSLHLLESKVAPAFA